METAHASISPESRFCVRADAIRCGSDLCVAVGGGTAAHVGAVSLAVYEPERDSATVSTITVFSHRDDAVSSFMAKTLSQALKCTVSVSAGIHLDSASPEEIENLSANARECCQKLISILREPD